MNTFSQQEIIVGPEESGKRLDVFLAEHFGISRAKSREFIRSGGLGPGKRPGTLVAESQVVRLLRELVTEVSAQPIENSEQSLRVHYEDEHLLVVDKPRAMHSTRLREQEEVTFADLLVSYLPSLATVSVDKREAGLVQRLDFYTAGLLVVAKSRPIWEVLRATLAAGELCKEYQAIVEGTPSVGEYRCKLDARKSKRVKTFDCSDPRTLSPIAESIENPKPRVFEEVHLELTKVLGSAPDTQGCAISHVELAGLAMRRHQVRAMMAHSGHPLLGDELYGAVFELKRERAVSLGVAIPEDGTQLEGFHLVASRLRFKHPKSSEELDIKRPFGSL